MNIKTILYYVLLAIGLSSCDLLSTDEVRNPNVEESAFLASPEAMKMWVNGANATFATSVSKFVEFNELLSDNYFNNYTRSSKVFDIPQINYRLGEVSTLSTRIGELIETADFGLSQVASADAATTTNDLFTLTIIKAYGHLLAGENFVALPLCARGKVVEWKEQLQTAIATLDEAIPLASSDDEYAFIHLLKARAYHRLALKSEAVAEAEEALRYNDHLVRTVTFDADKGFMSSIHEYLGSTMFQPLPRLDFLDPKYPAADAWNAPISIAKAEEAHLICAEALIADGHLDEARQRLVRLLALVADRDVTSYLDKGDNRLNSGTVCYPNGTDYLCAASPADSLRTGLIRTHGSDSPDAYYLLPTLSGTSVTETMLMSASSASQLLELLYLMRQEIFIAEGRRSADLGLRLPLSEVEASLHSNLPAAYTQAVIPDYIPLNGEMDAFTIDEEHHTVIILHNMNRVLVEHHATAFAHQ